MTRNLSVWIYLSLLMAALPSQVSAQSFPTKRVTIIGPLAPGGPADLLARITAKELQSKWGHPVIVENRVGAGGLLGINTVIGADPDGYTMLIHGYGIGSFPLLSKQARYDAEKDLSAISSIAQTPFFLMASSKLAAKDIPELVRYGKTNPGKLNVGSLTNSQQHLDTIMMLKQLGIEATLIPYNGAAQAAQALATGDIDLSLNALAAAQSSIDAGLVKILAVARSERNPSHPSVPTLRSFGYPVDVEAWLGLFAPARTPKDIVAKISADVQEAIARPDVVRQIAAINYEAKPSTPEAMSSRIRRDVTYLKEAVKIAGVTPQ